MLYCTVLLLAQAVVFQSPDPEASGPNLLADPGFEVGSEAPLTHWAPYGTGYQLAAGRRGRGIQISSRDGGQTGGRATVTLNQKTPEPLIVSGWSAAENISGQPNSGYSLYVDCVYADGTPLWGVTGKFRTGTHDWERVSFRVWPEKPIRSLSVYCLVRGHTGTARFDDIAVAALPAGQGRFDGFAVHTNAELKEGFLLRDQAREDAFVAIRPGSEVNGVRLEVEEVRRGNIRFFTATCTTRSTAPKLITIYWILPYDAREGRFYRDILRSEKIRPERSYSEIVPVPAGATGTTMRYPLLAVSPQKEEVVQVLAVPMNQPVITRLAYHAPWRICSVAFDVTLDRRVRRFPGTVRLRWAAFRMATTWGFRAAFRRYQELYPVSFLKRVPVEGIWMPFYDIAKVAGAEDFHFGFKEGTNNVAYDEAHGYLTFRYVEPQSHWLRMPKETPRTDQGVLDVLGKRAAAGDRRARAVSTSGVWDPEGHYRFSIRNTPWCDGAVFVLNPDPGLSDAGSKARLNYDPEEAEKRYAAGVDGEYLDSLEGWNDTLNFREDHLRESSVPPTFDRTTRRPCLLTAFSVYAYTAHVAGHVHRRGRLLMANSVPHRFGFLCHFLDVAGTETNWKRGGTFSFDSPQRMAYRRTLMGSKPYLFLQNTDWNAWTKADSEQYMRWCLFWGMYPGFFSPDASSRHYFSSPQRYDRDRELFKRYVPLIQRISRAGWEPVTLARADSPAVLVERWGSPGTDACYLTVFNNGTAPADVRLCLEGTAAEATGAAELLSRKPAAVAREKKGTTISLTLPAKDVAVLGIRR